jgi:anti-sigma regulatory factor (Ser/Thr protein kinase)
LRIAASGYHLPAIEVSTIRITPEHDLNGTLNESYPAVAASVTQARRAVTAFACAAGAPPAQLHDIRLAVSEALANAVVHAYPGEPGEVHVTAALTAGELWVLIADDGCGMRPGSDRAGLGLGLGLISLLSDHLSIVRRSSGGTELRMRFALHASAPAVDGQERGSVASATAPASSRFSTTA